MAISAAKDSLFPNEIIVRILSELPQQDIVHARAVCKAWCSIIEEFVSLQYLVWTFIHGTKPLGVSPPPGVDHDVDSSSVDVHSQLEELLQVEHNWSQLSFIRRDTVNFDDGKYIAPAGAMSSFADLKDNNNQLVGRYSLPLSLGDSRPEAIPFSVSDKHKDNAVAYDVFSDVLIVRSSETDSETTFSIMTLSKPDVFHPRAKQPTITCSRHGASSPGNVRIAGTRLISFSTDITATEDAVTIRTLHIWDWTTGELLRHQVIDVSKDYEGKSLPGEAQISVPVMLDGDHFAILRSVNGQPMMWLEIFSIGRPQDAKHWEGDKDLLALLPNSVLFFPPMRDDIWVECIELVCRPTSTDLSENRLFQVVLTVLPTENDLLSYYSFFAYTNQVLRVASTQSMVHWEKWGVNNTACFEMEMGIVDEMGLAWYSFGDRVAVLDCKGQTEGSHRLNNWHLRVLDFRPERIRRVKTERENKVIWPVDPKAHGRPGEKALRARTVHKDEVCKSRYMFPFKKPLFKCLLPFIETHMEGKFEAPCATVQMDARRVFIKKEMEGYLKTETEVLTT